MVGSAGLEFVCSSLGNSVRCGGRYQECVGLVCPTVEFPDSSGCVNLPGNRTSGGERILCCLAFPLGGCRHSRGSHDGRHGRVLSALLARPARDVAWSADNDGNSRERGLRRSLHVATIDDPPGIVAWNRRRHRWSSEQ